MFHASYFGDYISKETKSLKNKLLSGNGWAYADLLVFPQISIWHPKFIYYQ